MAKKQKQESLALQRFLRTYRKGEVIFEEGSSGSEMYLVHSGRVRLSVRRDQANQATLAVLGPGDFFGEMALVDDYRRSATASALVNNTRLIAVDRGRFLFMVRQQPEFALSIMHTMCQRLRALDSRLSAQGGSG